MQISAIGQTKKIAEANFLKTINDLAASSHSSHGDDYSATSTITPFSISKIGILSVTLRYSQIDSGKTIMMTVPILDISGISCDDDYLQLQSKSAITIYEENPKTQRFNNHTKKSSAHFGYISEDDERLMQLREELNELKKYYK
jgi:hypothetical protein